MCPFCIATATLLAVTGATSLGGVTALLAFKIRADRQVNLGEPADNQTSTSEEGHHAS